MNMWVGIPYVINGEPPESADCWTLSRAYAKQVLGLDWPRYMYDADHFVRDAHLLVMTEMQAHGRWKQVAFPMPGDLMILRMQGVPMHCAIYLGHGDMLHTMKGRMSCIERIENWQEAVTGIFRWIGGRDGS